MAYRILPSQDYLRQCLDYDPGTGLLTWRIRPLSHFKNAHACDTWNTQFSGSVAGSPGCRGYLRIAFRRVSYQAHRVIFKWIAGEEPLIEIDHRNGIGADNRWSNLRLASHTQNACNQPTHSNNQLGIKGVHRFRNGRFVAQIMVQGKVIYLGYFNTAAQAKAAYNRAARQLHGEFWRS